MVNYKRDKFYNILCVIFESLRKRGAIVSSFLSALSHPPPPKKKYTDIWKGEFGCPGACPVSFVVLFLYDSVFSISHADYMGINDDADRLKILQQITSMRADIVTSGSASPTRQLRSHVKGHVSPTKRIRSPVKGRQFSGESANSSAGHVYRENRSSRESTGVPPSKQRPSYYVNISVQEERPRTPDSGTSMINSPSQLSTSSDSPESSCISSPVKFHSADMLCEGDKMDMNELNKLQTVATLRYHNMKRISRSMDYLFPVSYLWPRKNAHTPMRYVISTVRGIAAESFRSSFFLLATIPPTCYKRDLGWVHALMLC